MRRLLFVFALAAIVYPVQRNFELHGCLVPASKAAISLFGATTPFHAEGLADSRGCFRFRALAPGQYTVAVFVPGRGETRHTVDIGSRTADAKGRVSATIQLEDSLVAQEALQVRATVSARNLSIPDSARREYLEAQKKLSRRDVANAIAHLERAVAMAPEFSEAWNNLGTIAYQSHQYPSAEGHFRKALEQEPGSFEPLVNLGGVLLTEGKLQEALQYNLSAVRSRPRDALANSQLGMTYFAAGNLDLGEKYLEIAKRIDSGHFSYPQLTLAQIHLLRHERAAAAEEFRDFLRRHPDARDAGRVEELLQKLEE